MSQSWSGWKRFPEAKSRHEVDAPAGPGVYEVRHSLTGRVVSFGHTNDIAATLTELKSQGGAGGWTRWFRSEPTLSRLPDLEYRTCGASSRAEAKTAASRLLGLRQAAFRRRMDMGSAVRH